MNELLNLQSLENICRVCLQDCDGGLSMFNEFPGEDETIVIYDILTHITDIKIINEEELPNLLCNECLNFLHQVIKFRRLSNESQNKILDYYIVLGEKKPKLEELSVDPSEYEIQLPMEIKHLDSEETSLNENSLYHIELKENHNIFLKEKENSSEFYVNNFSLNTTMLPSGSNSSEGNQVELQSDPLESADSDNSQLERITTNEFMKVTKVPSTPKESFDSYIQIMNKRSKVHVCNICPKLCLNKNVFLKHLRSHDELNPFLCNICSKKFSKLKLYCKHLTTHVTNSSYSCNVCGKKYKLLSSLKTHYHIHSKKPHFVCSTCGKEFKQRYNLNVHLRSHATDMHQ